VRGGRKQFVQIPSPCYRPSGYHSTKTYTVNISFSEIVVVFLVALLLFGPEQLPQIARQLGAIAAEFRKGSQALRREWYNAVYPPAEEIRKDLSSHANDLRALRSQVLAPPPGSVSAPTRGPHQQSETAHGSSQGASGPQPDQQDSSKETTV
jgi:TatA/E family protein of Tat protein translocase